MPVEASSNEFEIFARKTRPWLRHEAYRLCGDWHEADDLVQLTMWKMYRRWNNLHRPAESRAYARRVMVSTFLTERRRLRWSREIHVAEPYDYATTASPQDAINDRSVLLPAMRRLGPRQQAVLSLRFFSDLSIEETAHILHCAPGTVTSQTVRALQALRRELHILPGAAPATPYHKA